MGDDKMKKRIFQSSKKKQSKASKEELVVTQRNRKSVNNLERYSEKTIRDYQETIYQNSFSNFNKE